MLDSGREIYGIFLTAMASELMFMFLGEVFDVVYPALMMGVIYLLMPSRAVELLFEVVGLVAEALQIH